MCPTTTHYLELGRFPTGLPSSDPIIGMGTARHSEFKIIYFNASKSQLIFGLEIKSQLQFKCIISYKEGPQPDIECEPVLHMSTYFKTKIPKSGLI